MLIDELKAESDKLSALLTAPEPGLYTWLSMVNDRIQAIAKLWGLPCA